MTGIIVFLNKSTFNSSNLALEIVDEKSFPSARQCITLHGGRILIGHRLVMRVAGTGTRPVYFMELSWDNLKDRTKRQQDQQTIGRESW